MAQIKNVPQKIYLVVGFENSGEFEENTDFHDLRDVGWCTEKLSSNDLKYYHENTVQDLLEILNNVVEKVDDGCNIEGDEVLEAHNETAKDLLEKWGWGKNEASTSNSDNG